MKYTEAILSNSARKLLWFEITKILIAVLNNKFIVLFIIIFGTLSFPIGTARIVCRAGSMHLSGVRPSVRLSAVRPSVCPVRPLPVAAAGQVPRRYRSIAARPGGQRPAAAAPRRGAAANAGSATLSADAGREAETDLFVISISSQPVFCQQNQ